MSERTWGDVEKEYQEYDEICERHNLDVEDIEAEVDGSVDAWVRQSEAAKVIFKLEAALDHAEMCMASCLKDNRKWHDEYLKLVRYVKVLLPPVNSALHLAQIHGMKPDLKEAHEAYQDLSDETQEAIEDVK